MIRLDQAESWLCRKQDPGAELGRWVGGWCEKEQKKVWGGFSKHKGPPRRAGMSRVMQRLSMRVWGDVVRMESKGT